MKYSIITINYNNCEGLRRTIESVARQTYRNYEFIVIDGASTDGSGEVLKQYDNAITYWVSEPDKGIYNAMNKGIARATGDYLNFMNSGDCFYADDVLERVASHTSDADIIVGRDYHFSATKQQGHASIQPPRLSMLTFFVSTLDHQSSFIRRSLFDGCPYREDFRLVSDWIFFTEQVVDHERRVEFIPNIICRREEGGLSEKQRERVICMSVSHLASMPTIPHCPDSTRPLFIVFSVFSTILRSAVGLFVASNLLTRFFD